MFPPVNTLVFVPTLATFTTTSLSVAGIFYIQQMSLTAMSTLRPVLSRFTTTAVLLMNNRFQMCWIYANSVTAKVVKFQFFRQRPNRQFISHCMGQAPFVQPCRTSITMTAEATCPQPTGISFYNLLPKPFSWRVRAIHKSAVLPPLVMGTTKTSSSIRHPSPTIWNGTMPSLALSHKLYYSPYSVGVQHG